MGINAMRETLQDWNVRLGLREAKKLTSAMGRKTFVTLCELCCAEMDLWMQLF